MYKLLIVDDEEIVSNGLKKFVNWDALGFTVAATATSVEEAENILNEINIDVVLTDIHMPVQNGLSLLEIIDKEFPDIKTIILSGYEDFNYAKKAMRLGCFDYLTKPVNFEELTNIFLKLGKILDEENLNKSRNKEYVDIQQDILLNNLVKGYEDNLNKNKIDSLNLHLPNDTYFLIRMQIRHKLKDYTNFMKVKSEIYDGIKSILDKHSFNYIFNNDVSELCSIVYPKEKSYDFKPLLEVFCNHICTSLGVEIYISISNPSQDINEIPTLYAECGKTLQYMIMENKSMVLKYQEVTNFDFSFEQVPSASKQTILNYLSESDGKSLLNYIESQLTILSNEYKFTINQLRSYIIEIYFIIEKYLSNFDYKNNSKEKLYSSVKDLIRQNSFFGIKASLENHIKSITETLEDISDHPKHNIIENAIVYINENYYKDISLNMLSEILYIHPIYLSKLFKEKTGENFIKYLTNIRIEKSKELLKDNTLKIYDISESVGYESPKYFSKVFKEVVGLTPKEFRESLNN